MDLWVWHALQTSNEWMAFAQWAATEKTTSFSVEKEGDAYGFHGLQRCCASWIPFRRPDRQQGVLFRRCKTFAWSNSPKKTGFVGKQLVDFAPSHNAIVIREHLAKSETNTIQQPPISRDLAPCDFFLFGRLKKPLRGTRYNTRDEVMEKSKMALMAILQTDYEKCFQDWIKHWHKCVAVDGEYFEGDNIDYDE